MTSPVMVIRRVTEVEKDDRKRERRKNVSQKNKITVVGCVLSLM